MDFQFFSSHRIRKLVIKILRHRMKRKNVSFFYYKLSDYMNFVYYLALFRMAQNQLNMAAINKRQAIRYNTK